MANEYTVLRSIFKGLILSCVLILVQIGFSGTPGNDDAQVKVAKFEKSSELPKDNSNGSEVSVKTWSLHSTGTIEICREVLYILEILFIVNVNLNQEEVSIPLPLLGYFKILFTSVISVNAP
jgi:hypothetical protein